jgi:hypothetical protein
MKKNHIHLACFFATVILLACQKSSPNSNTNNNSKTQADSTSASLVGNWIVVKYIAANFDTTEGETYIPNDTIYPTHSEYHLFTKDSLYGNSWETFTYYDYTVDSFVNTQNKEFFDTAAYTSTATYYVLNNSSVDTSYIVALSDTELVTMDKTFRNLTSPSSGVLFDLFTYYTKQ